MTDRDDRPWSTRSPDREWDDVVVGSGMGGMSCAAMLSRLGRRVLVLEHHYVPGGFTQTFRRKKWTWDVGVHAVGEVDERALLGRVLERLTGGSLAWTSLGATYDEFHFPDLRIDFPDRREAFESVLRDAFPREGGAVDGYLRAVRDVSGAMRTYYLSRLLPPGLAPLGEHLIARRAHAFLAERTSTVLDRLTADPRLRQVLTAQWAYYGSPATRSSFAVHALVARHFSHGGYYPVGGSASIARALLGTVAAHGGATRIKADVAEIEIEGGRAVGVRLADGERIRARRVISAVGARATALRLLPPEVRARAWARSIASLPVTPCHVCLNLGFEGDIRGAGAGAANQWFYETWDPSAVAWDAMDPRAEAPVLYCSFPSLKDPAHDPGPDGLHTGEVVTFVPHHTLDRFRESRWRRRPGEYEAIKKDWTDRLLAQLLRHMPALRDRIRWVELSTPLSTEHFTRAPAGAIYGLEPTPERYRNPWLRPRTPVPGLFLTGADMASVGVMGAFVGGVLTASACEPRRALPWLRDAIGTRSR